MLYIEIPNSKVLGLRMSRNGQMERSISIGPVQPRKVVHLERFGALSFRLEKPVRISRQMEQYSFFHPKKVGREQLYHLTMFTFFWEKVKALARALL